MGVGFEPATLPDGEDWLWRPVMRKFFKYHELIDGSLSIEDVAMMNDLIDLYDENDARRQDAQEKARG